MKKSKLKIIVKKSGFSLLEMMIALFIFSLITVVSVAVFSRIIQVRKSSQKVQSDIEVARIAVDAMAKNMRMSDGLRTSGPGNQEIYMYNNSQKECIRYRFSSGTLATSQIPPANLNSPNCNPTTLAYPSFRTIAGGGASSSVTGGFTVTQTSSTAGAEAIGRAAIFMSVMGAGTVQTSVSFRDYQGIIQ